jgi:hypothetical protein
MPSLESIWLFPINDKAILILSIHKFNCIDYDSRVKALEYPSFLYIAQPLVQSSPQHTNFIIILVQHI